jgi:hypothetical protein
MSKNIYDDLPEVRGEIVNWDEIGQMICGTYIGKSEPINTKFGLKVLYEFLEDDGSIKKCWERKNINDVMKLFKPGVIVKIVYTASIPSKKGNDFKEIKVYGNPKVTNEEWLAQREAEPISAKEAEEIVNGPEEEVKIEDVEEDKSEAPFLTESEKKKLIIQITELATGKLSATDGEDVKNKVMEATELAFIDSNLGKIAEALSALPDRK